MSKRTVYERTRKDARRASRELKKGDKVYAIHYIANERIPYEADRAYSEYVVKGEHPLLGGAIISGSLSVEGLVLLDGPIYMQPPKGVRAMTDPGSQCAGPLPEGDNVRDFSDYEITRMEKQVEADKEARKPKRKTWWS